SSVVNEFRWQLAPSTTISVLLHRFSAVRQPVLAIPAAQRVDPPIGRSNLPMRVREQRALDFPYVAVGGPPVVAAEHAQIDNGIAGDAAGEVEVWIEIAERERTRRGEDRLAAVQPRVPRSRHRSPAAAVAIEEDHVIELVDRFEAEGERRI